MKAFSKKQEYSRRFTVTCPYCGFKNMQIANDWHGTKIIYCETEDGGCDKKLAFEYEVDWIVQAYKIKSDSE